MTRKIQYFNTFTKAYSHSYPQLVHNPAICTNDAQWITKTILLRKEVYYLMRKGCNPNREQKELLRKNKKVWEEWLYITQTTVTFTFKHKTSGEVIELERIRR